MVSFITRGKSLFADISSRPTLIALIAANLVPLAGVFVWDWQVFDILLVFWCENVLIGFFNILRILCAGWRRRNPVALPNAAFFTLHYGMFTAVHGVFVFEMFGPSEDARAVAASFPPDLFAVLQLPGAGVALSALFLSHLFSFLVRFIGDGEIDRTSFGALMMAPYGRVVILHLVILFGGFLVHITGDARWALALLVGIKIAFDLAAHKISHEKLAARPEKG